MATEGLSSQVEWSDTAGKFTYDADTERDTLLIISNFPTNNPEVVPRRSRGELTDDERQKLEHQGVPRDCHHDDLSIIKTRQGLDSTYHLMGVEYADSERGFTRDDMKKQIISVINNTDRRGVVFHYMGHGKRGTGDWCFSDGFIIFRELMDLYMQHFRGRVLTIVSDCSYSGSWVREAMVFMDEHGVGPCGHVTKENGILVKVFTSCLSNEIPAELAFSTHCAANDKNTGDMSYTLSLRCNEIHDGQHPSTLDFTVVQCKNKIDQPCTMAPGSTWQKWSAQKRIMSVTGTNRGRPAWDYVLLLESSKRKQWEPMPESLHVMSKTMARS